MTTTDQHFIQETLAGNTQAFSHLVEKYQDFVYTIAYKIVKVREEAEEVAQDSFIKAYESLDSYRGEAKFSSWLYSIVYRKALDRYRKNTRTRTLELVEEMNAVDVVSIDNALHQLEKAERNILIKKCIDSLPESEGAIILFFYFEELSIKEIVDLTGLTQDNVKVKLHRSRKKLFTLLQQYVLPEHNNNNGKAI